MQKKRKTTAFTLVELMVAMAILGIVGVALTSFMIFSTQSMFWSIRKSMVTSDFRKFTSQITQDALNSSSVFLYDSFDQNDIDPGGRRFDGLSGDCIVLVKTTPLPNINSPRFYERIIVYSRDNNSDRSVFRRERIFENPNIPETLTTPVETVINDERGNFGAPRLMMEQTTGHSNNQFFYNVNDTTFMIHGELTHGRNIEEINNTYNLTISTRG